MYIAIDMDRLVFLHKHHDHDTLSALSFLECGQQHSIAVENTERSHFLSTMSRLDLCILYKNTTDSELVSQDNVVLRQQLADIVDHVPAHLALRNEVEAQVAHVEDRLHAGERFSYVLGARVPADPVELFPLKGRGLSPDQLTAAVGRAQRLTPAGATPAPSAPETRPTPERGEGVKVRATSVRPVIWDHADRVWEAEGKPTDRNTVMALRKRMMGELEAKGVKRTSSSNELGNWMKARLG